MIVDADGRSLGTMNKMAAHYSGTLHRAFSVFIFNAKGQLLIQQRAFNKYHSGGLWSNTCCSHPFLGERVIEAAQRRLNEEMGISCQLTEIFQFTYRHEFDNGLTEHEYDHVFIGTSDQMPKTDPDEVAGFKYLSADELISELSAYPERFTAWFKLCLTKVIESYYEIN